MTRIDLIPTSEMHDKHIRSGIHEILRVFGLVRKAQARKINQYNFHQKVKPPLKYCLGEGSVKFFYDKLGFITSRYAELCEELRNRGGSPNEISREDLLDGIALWWQNDYTPDEEALTLNRSRIKERVDSWE